MTEPRASLSTVGRVPDHHAEPHPAAPCNRTHHDSGAALDHAVDKLIATAKRRVLPLVLSMVIGSGATAGGFVLADPNTPAVVQSVPAASVAPVCEPSEDVRKVVRQETRLLLDYLVAMINALRLQGIDVDEPRPPQYED